MAARTANINQKYIRYFSTRKFCFGWHFPPSLTCHTNSTYSVTNIYIIYQHYLVILWIRLVERSTKSEVISLWVIHNIIKPWLRVLWYLALRTKTFCWTYHIPLLFTSVAAYIQLARPLSFVKRISVFLLTTHDFGATFMKTKESISRYIQTIDNIFSYKMLGSELF